MPYIKQQNQKDLLSFKYKGGTSSITYEYLWSPFAQFLLKFVPAWVAPNLITLIAFLIVVVNHFIFMFGGQDGLTDDTPRWKMALFAITMFVYQHLDNLDGKQARKTKTSSPVGMLFDHGADALTSIMFGMQILKIIHMKDLEMSLYFVLVIIMLPNFAGLWVQYSVGEFKLDRINPIDQGLPSYVILCLLGCYFDYTKWNTFHWIANYNMEFLLGFSAIVVVVVIKMCKNIFKQSTRQKFDVLNKLWLPAVLIMVLMLVRVLGFRWLYNEHFLPFIYTLLSFWGRSLMLMQVSSVTKQECYVFNRGTNFFLASMAVFLGFNSLLLPYMGEYLWSVCAVQFLLLAQFILSFLSQAARILKIQIFKIPYSRQQKAQ